jgi:hypothetical protein
LEKRTKKFVLAHLKKLTDKDRIKVVTMDMWGPYSPTLQKQPQHRQARYGDGFDTQAPGRYIPAPVLPLGTDVDALLLMLEAEERQ